MDFIKRNLDYVWPALGFAAVLASFGLLFQEFRGQSLGPQLIAAFKAIPPSHYLLSLGATIAGTGTITVTLREGQSWAAAAVIAAMDKNAENTARLSILFIDVSSD